MQIAPAWEGDSMDERTPVKCPECGQKTGLFAKDDTIYINVPWKCRKCKQEVIINFKAH